MKQHLTLTRRGDFEIEVNGPHHCGIAATGDYQRIKYVVSAKCTTKLDSRGFLFEQRSVDEVMQRLSKTRLSCELLSQACAKAVLDMIRRENPKCKVRKIKVVLSAAPFQADMAYTFKF